MRSVCTCSAEESGAHLISKVHDDEGRVGHTGFLKVGAAGVLLVELLSPVLIRPLWHLKQDAGYVRAFIEANRRRTDNFTDRREGTNHLFRRIKRDKHPDQDQKEDFHLKLC